MMKISYINAKGERLMLEKVIHIQNVYDGHFAVAFANGAEYCLRADRIECIIDDELFKEAK